MAVLHSLVPRRRPLCTRCAPAVRGSLATRGGTVQHGHVRWGWVSVAVAPESVGWAGQMDVSVLCVLADVKLCAIDMAFHSTSRLSVCADSAL
jgi:hypothetical protein